MIFIKKRANIEQYTLTIKDNFCLNYFFNIKLKQHLKK